MNIDIHINMKIIIDLYQIRFLDMNGDIYICNFNIMIYLNIQYLFLNPLKKNLM